MTYKDTPGYKDENHPQHKKMLKMFSQDNKIITCMIIALWLCLGGIFYTVTQAAVDYSVYIIMVIGAALGIFSTIALIALRSHLTTDKKDMYLTDIMFQRESSGLMMWFDILFIMGLCYISLLLPILLRGTVLVGAEGSGMDYTLVPQLLIAVLITTCGFLYYVVIGGNKKMRQMYNMVYDEKGENQ